MGTLICTVELNKTDGKGITVTVANADGKITQTVSMDGTKMTFTVKGENDFTTITQEAAKITHSCTGKKATSTIVQVEDTITVTVDNFVVKAAKTIVCKSDETVAMESVKETTLKSGT